MVDKAELKDVTGRPLTQSLFLEHNYSDYAQFTLNDEDKTYKGRVYPSLKKLFLEMADPTEYQFAKKHLLGWKHWKRLNENKALRPEFDEWREELEIMLRSEGILAIAEMTDNFQAQKFLAEKGWEKRGAGRPPKSKEDSQNVEDRIAEELKDTLVRMDDYKRA